MAPTLMAKKSVLMCFKRLDNEDSIVKQGKKHIQSLFPHGTKRFKKMVLGLVFPVEEEEKTNPDHKQIAYFLQATTELSLELLSGDFRLPVSPLCMDKKRNGEREEEMHFGS